jgi:hypothetical protein
MPKISIKVNGEILRFFDSFSFSTQIDTISSSVSFDSFLDIEAFDYTPIQVYRDNILIFTGEITNKRIPDETPAKPFNYKADSLTHILSESTLPTEAYPLQLENNTLKDIIEYICGFFNVTVVFDESASDEAAGQYKLSNLGLGSTAAALINELITNAGLILTHDAYGRLIVTKTIVQSEISLPKYMSSGKSFDLKKFFYNYIALGQAPVNEDSDIQAIARFSNIDERRNITKIQDSGGIDTIEKKAEGMRADSLKSINHSLSFNQFFCNVGDFVYINDTKLVINRLDYTYNGNGELSSISLLDNQIYDR